MNKEFKSKEGEWPLFGDDVVAKAYRKFSGRGIPGVQ